MFKDNPYARFALRLLVVVATAAITAFQAGQSNRDIALAALIAGAVYLSAGLGIPQLEPNVGLKLDQGS